MDGLIETVRFGAWGPAAPDCFDQWSQHSRNHVLSRSGTHFRAEASFWVLAGMVIAEQWLDAFAGARTRDRLATAPTDQVTFVIVLEGAMTYCTDEATPVASEAVVGDVVLLDLRRPYTFQVTRGRTIVISLDRGALEEEAGPLSLAGLMPRAPEVGMTVDFASALARRLPGMVEASAAPMASALRRLMVAAVRRGHAAVTTGWRAERAAALAYMETRPPGSLDVEEMTLALNVTRATLYRSFRSDGGVLAYDRRRRLRLLHRALTEPDTGQTLSELGLRFGFFDVSNLSRQFRAQFGLSMSDVRRHLKPVDGPIGAPSRYRAAVEQFV